MRKIVLCVLFLGMTLANASEKDWRNDCASKTFLSEVARYLYRWHLTPQQIQSATTGSIFEFWVRKLDYELDPDDHSIYQEIVIPKIGVRVVVKKTDYKIPELDLVVKGTGYRISSFNTVMASRYTSKRDEYKVVTFDYLKLKKHLFETRNDVSFPTPSLLREISKAASFQIENYFKRNKIPIPSNYERKIYVSPLSPVSNEIWVFWELGQLIFRFSSDVDIEHPAMWQHQPLQADIFNLDTQVIVSLTEVPGSNAYLTRDAAGRILYNCIIRGKRIDMAK